MSYQEIPFEEKAVQLIPEDLEILSEYSWDMTGYTSRFGFFYLGNEKADVEGLTRWQAEHIFQLTPSPPGMEIRLAYDQVHFSPEGCKSFAARLLELIPH